MHKFIVAGLVVVAGLAGPAAVAPAMAASSVPSCTTDTSITPDDAASIAQQLRVAGYDVTAVEDWSGCVRADVKSADGSGSYKAYFDPDTLSLITTTEVSRG